MKAVLISIRPQWCELIASGKKTIEVRKTRPKIETPFKCYIYCTKDAQLRFWYGKKYSYADDRSHNAFDKCGNGKVIGEFVCDSTRALFEGSDMRWWHDIEIDKRGKEILRKSCLGLDEMLDYAKGSDLFMWHISDLVIYDEPKELGEFRGLCKYMDRDCGACPYYDYNIMDCKGRTITRPPQSWCYVEVET